jgi:hypothetical protein
MEIRWKYNGNRIEIARVYLPTAGKLGEIEDSIRISMVFSKQPAAAGISIVFQQYFSSHN